MECNAKWYRACGSWSNGCGLKIENAKRKFDSMTMQYRNAIQKWIRYSYGKSIVYSQAARKSVNSGIRLNKKDDSYKVDRSMISGMASAPPFGGSHPVPMWEDWAVHSSTLVFSYTQLTRWEGRWGNGKVQKSAKTVLLNIVSEWPRERSAQSMRWRAWLQENGFRGRNMEWPWIKPIKLDSVVNSYSAGTWEWSALTSLDTS